MINPYSIAVFVFGLIFGSFLNVCIYRLPRDLSVVAPRSFCPECGVQLIWRYNIPVLSFALLRGRCHTCSRKISFRYPLVELTTAFAFFIIVSRHGWTPVALKWIVFISLLTVLFWTDLEERILPDEITLGGSFVGLILAYFVKLPIGLEAVFVQKESTGWHSVLQAGIAGLVLSIPIWLFGAFWSWMRKREALGFGDVKLLAMLGVFLGLTSGVFAVTVGAVSGALVGILVAIFTRKDVRSYELPFGSFLCLGAALVPVAAMPMHFSLGVP